MENKKACKIAEQIIYDYVGGADKWEDVMNLDFTATEVQDILTKCLIENYTKNKELILDFQKFYQNDKFDDERTFEWNVENYLKIIEESA
jgi:hypothetical protein